MSNQETYDFPISLGSARLLLDCINWKHGEGAMDYNDWKILVPLLIFFKDKFPELMHESNKYILEEYNFLMSNKYV